MFDLPTNLIDFLTWIVYGGGGAIAVSWILEKMPWYQEKQSDVKQNIYFGIVSGFTLIVYAILNYVPAEVLAMIAPWFGIIAVTFVNVYIGTGFHRASKATPATIAEDAQLILAQNESMMAENKSMMAENVDIISKTESAIAENTPDNYEMKG